MFKLFLSKARILFILAIMLLLAGSLAIRFGTDELEAQGTPSWLEPRALSVADLINGGLDPTILAGTPIVWQPGQALLQFVSGEKSGSTVTVNAKMLPEATNNAWCLGQDGIRDQWPIVAPESRMRITSNGVDITNEIFNVQYFPAGQSKPVRGSSDGPARYDEVVLIRGDGLNFDSQGRLIMPANMGCKVIFNGGAANGNIEIEFTHTLQQHIRVSVIESFSHDFKNFYTTAPANFGQLTAFNQQMVDVKGGGTVGRHDLVVSTPPDNADYVVWNFAPTRLDMYAPQSSLESIKPYPGSGTYRFRNRNNGDELSSDWVSIAGIPMNFHAIDRDFEGDTTFLTYFDADEYRFMGLEVLAFNTEYNSCMTSGTCSTAFVEEAGSHRKPATFYYLEVERIAPGLTQIPLCSVGAAWTTANSNSMCSHNRTLEIESDNVIEIAPDMDSAVYLPIITRPAALEPDDPNANCPCGWFTDDGRMLEYVLPPGW